MDHTIKTILCKQRGHSFSNSCIQRLFLPTHNVRVSPHDGRSNNPSNLRQSKNLVLAQNPSTSPPTTSPTCTPTFLSQIHIENFALVDNQSVALHPGLNVITGESGSGKSVFIEAINQLLGAPSDTNMIRSPSPSCTIQGTFSIAPKDLHVLVSLLQDTLQLPSKAISSLTTTNYIVIQREMSIIASRNNNNNIGKNKKNTKGRGGGKVKSKCYINGVIVSLKSVRELSKCLIDMNGQNSSLSMREASQQLAALDTMVGINDSDGGDLLSEFRDAWKDLQETRGQLSAFEALGDEEERLQLQGMVDQVFRHIGCMAGEDRLLRGQMKKLDSQRSSSERCQIATVSLGEGGVSDVLLIVEQSIRSVLIDQQRVAAALEETAGRTGDNDSGDGNEEDEKEEEEEDDDDDNDNDGEGQLEDILESLSEAREAILIAREDIKRYARTHQFSQQEYDEMSARLEQLTKLCKEYDVVDVDDLIEKATAVEAQLDAYYQMEGRREEIEGNAEARLKRAQLAAVALSRVRREAAQALGPAVTAVLGELAMGSAQFQVLLQWDKIGDSRIYQEEDNNNNNNNNNNSSSIKYENALPIPADLAAQCGQQAGIYKIKQSGANNGGGNRTMVGLDTAEFVFAAGPDEPLKSLSSVASGGEAARIVLALKAAPSSLYTSSSSGSKAPLGITRAPLSEQQPAITVLDEIDSSIGSRLGLVIGRILRRMAGGGGGGGNYSSDGLQQVVCISHLPQVAAHGQHHIVVRKGHGSGNDGKQRVVTRFEVLDSEQERLDEVAAMLGLHEDAARELMAQVE